MRAEDRGHLAPRRRRAAGAAIRTAVGHVPNAPLVLIDVRATDGVVGRSYIFAYAPLALRRWCN